MKILARQYLSLFRQSNYFTKTGIYDENTFAKNAKRNYLREQKLIIESVQAHST